MGGYGALTGFLRIQVNTNLSSAFAPISNPLNCPWGEKDFGNYLGSEKSTTGKNTIQHI